MSIKSYLFKSTREEVEALEDTGNLHGTFDGIESNGIDPTTLTVLESILTGEDVYQITEKGEYTIIKRVNEDDDNSSLFISSSDELMNRLKDLKKSDKSAILCKWCSTQEMQLYGWTPKKAEFIIDWLVQISKEAGSSEEEIILFIDREAG